MGCAFVKPSNGVIHPAKSLNDSPVKQELVHTEGESLNTSEKLIGWQSQENIAAPVPTMAEDRSLSAQSPEVVPRERAMLRRTASGHVVPQTVERCDLGEGFLSVHELYNLMNDGQRMPYLHDPTYMLLLDVREREAFSEQHITTARHSTAVDTEFDCLLSQGKLDKFMTVVVYDRSSEAKDVDSPLASFVSRLRERSDNVVVLSGGFCRFHETYPFLCNNLTIRSEQDRMRLFKSYPSVVLEGDLYQGNVKHSLDKEILQNLKITHVLNVSTECKNQFPETFTYKQVKVEDETSAQLGPRFQSAAEFIGKAIGGGGRVFIHCVQGKSRSSSCTIAYLMSSRGWTLKDSHDYLKERRSIAAPNRGFLIQLSKFEESIFGKVLSSVDELYF